MTSVSARRAAPREAERPVWPAGTVCQTQLRVSLHRVPCAITRASLLLLPGAVLTGVARSLFGADIRAIDAVNTPTETRGVFCFQSARTRSGGLLAPSVGDTLLRLDYSTYSGRVLSTKASCVAFLSRIYA